MSDEPLRITNEDLFSKTANEYVETQQWLNQTTDVTGDRPWLIKVIYANWFYLAFWCGLGGLSGWAIMEPTFDDNAIGESALSFLLFPVVACCIGLFLGAAEGVMCRNYQRAMICGLVGLAIGFGGGLVALLAAGMVFGLMLQLAIAAWKNPQPGEAPGGFAFLILMMGRAAAWAIAAIPAGIGQGIALREKRVILNGLIGGVLGGLVGGLLFDPIGELLTTADGQATYSRAVGFTCIGLCVGCFVGLVEGWTKTAWIVMLKGPLAGKQFVLFRDTTVVGSTPKADIYLFKDDAIEPQHCIIYNRGGRFELVDQDTPDGTYVNGIPVKNTLLQTGDQIVMGKTVLEFSLKQSES